MTEPRESDAAFDPIDPGSDEALSAYLAGELDDSAVTAFEARLHEEPALGAQLDALAGALAALGRVDEVEPPAGFADRLAARLEAEAGVADLGMRRRERPARRWAAVATAAAAVGVLAIAGGRLLAPPATDREVALGEGGQAMRIEAQAPLPDAAQEYRMADEESDDFGASAALDAASAPAPALAAPQPMAADDGAQASGGTGGQATSGGADGARQDSASGPRLEHGADRDTADSGGGAAADDSTASNPDSGDVRRARGGGAVVADEGAAFSEDDELRAYYQGRPEAEDLRGMPREAAVEAAARHAEQVRQAPAFRSGTRPDACLDEVLEMDHGPRVVARAEWAQWQGGGSLVYLLAVAGPQSTQIDGFELWVMQPDGCNLRRSLSWR